MGAELTFHIWGRLTAMERAIGILAAASGTDRHQGLLDALEEAVDRVYYTATKAKL